jgi:hypothetical protein
VILNDGYYYHLLGGPCLTGGRLGSQIEFYFIFILFSKIKILPRKILWYILLPIAMYAHLSPPSSSRHWEKTHRGGHFVTFFPDLIYSSIFSLFFKFGGEMLEEKISRPKKAQKRTEPKPCGDRKRRGSGNKGGKKKKKKRYLGRSHHLPRL